MPANTNPIKDDKSYMEIVSLLSSDQKLRCVEFFLWVMV